MKLVDNLKKEAFAKGIQLRSEESMKWFRQRAHNIRRINRSQDIMRGDTDLRNRQAIGRMYFWYYDPKHKETLPYYDAFPLGIIVGPAKNGFYGLNLHYLPPLLRAQFLDSLLDITTNKKFNENTKFKITYDLLKSTTKFKEFKPCFKHYLTKHVKSRFALVPAEDWEIATFLPAADWQKRNALGVYRDSRKMI